jgi:hypothetical protein
MKIFFDWKIMLCVIVVFLCFIYNQTLFSSFCFGWCLAIFTIGLIETIKDYRKKKKKNKDKE